MSFSCSHGALVFSWCAAGDSPCRPTYVVSQARAAALASGACVHADGVSNSTPTGLAPRSWNILIEGSRSEVLSSACETTTEHAVLERSSAEVADDRNEFGIADEVESDPSSEQLADRLLKASGAAGGDDEESGSSPAPAPMICDEYLLGPNETISRDCHVGPPLIFGITLLAVVMSLFTLTILTLCVLNRFEKFR